MEKHILTRDSFVNEIYSQKPQEEMNEGILDFFKSMLGKEWNSIKSKNTPLRDEIKKVDRSLGGFSFIKMSKAGVCKEIRQVVCDFANDLLDAKMKEFEDGKKLQKTLMGLKNADEVTDEDKKSIENSGKVSDYLKKFDLKDKALIDKLQTHEKRIKTICDGNPDLIKWSNLLMDGVRNIINDYIINEYEKTEDLSDKEKKKLEKTKKELENKQKKDEEDRKKIDAEQKKKQEEQIKQLEKEREDAIAGVNATPIKNQTGDKAHQTLKSEFDDIYAKFNESNKSHQYSFNSLILEGDEKWNEKKKILQGDVHLGLGNIARDDIEDLKYPKKVLEILNILVGIIDEVSKQGKMFKEVPSDSVQAMYIGLSTLIQHSLSDGNLDDKTKELLARCSIDSDKTVGFGLPLLNPKNPKDGNIFASIAQKLTNVEKKGNIAKILNNDQDELNKFVKNATKMFDDIRKKAEDLLENKKKQDEEDAKKIEDDIKKSNN